MLVGCLFERQRKRSKKVFEQIAATISRPSSRIRLASLYPAIGSRQQAVVLGFTPDGDHILSIDKAHFRIHKIKIIEDDVKVCSLVTKQYVQLHLPGSSLHSTAVEAVFLDEDDLRSFLVCCNESAFQGAGDTLSHIYIFIQGVCYILDAAPTTEYAIISAFPVRRPHNNDGFYAVNTGRSLYFYVLGVLPEASIESDIRKPIFHSKSCRNKWFWSSIKGCNYDCDECDIARLDKRSAIQPPIDRIIINCEILIQVLFNHYYPTIDVVRDISDMEMRVLGLGEMPSQVMITIAVSATYTTNERKRKRISISMLVSVDIAKGDAQIIKFIDLASFCNAHCNAQQLSFTDSLDILSENIIRRHHFLSLPSLSHSILSNRNMIDDGVSVSEIRHPFLPLTIYNDEDSA